MTRNETIKLFLQQIKSSTSTKKSTKSTDDGFSNSREDLEGNYVCLKNHKMIPIEKMKNYSFNCNDCEYQIYSDFWLRCYHCDYNICAHCK